MVIFISYTYNQRSVLTVISNKVSELRKFSIDDKIWTEAAAICHFLEVAASLTENQSGSTYATLSVTIKAYKSFLTECIRVIDAKDIVLKPIAEAIYYKSKKNIQ